MTEEDQAAAESRQKAPSPGGHLDVEAIVYVSKSAAPEGGYYVYTLKEGDPSDQSKPFELASHQVQNLPETIPNDLLLSAIPDYLQDTSSRKVHVVVSTGSGTGLALMFYESVLRPLLAQLGLASSRTVSASAANAFALTITQDAHCIRRFARDLITSTRAPNASSVQHTVILLSGDGGLIELLNGNAPGDHVSASDTTLPLVATLPFGTGNALFHSLHKPLYGAPDVQGPSPLVLGLRTLLHGLAKPLPSFQVNFSAGSRTIAYTKPEEGPTKTANEDSQEKSDAISQMHGAIVASYGVHSQLVWESDTPEYRKHGSKRFGMVANELMKENHAYNAIVEPTFSNGNKRSRLDKNKHAYILATLVSNLERTFTISPAAQPLDGQLRLVHFGPVPAQKVMEIMMQAYNNGNHIGMKWEAEDGKTEQVGYDAVNQIKITTHEEEARWRKVCIDGTIVELPKGGSMTVITETKHHLQVLINRSLH